MAQPLRHRSREALAADISSLCWSTRFRRRRSREINRVGREQQLAPLAARLIAEELAGLDQPMNGGGRESRDAAILLERQQRRVDEHERSSKKPSSRSVPAKHNSQDDCFFRL